jgi:valyl-tRNA synthetase
MSREAPEDQPTESPNTLPKAYDPSLIEERWAHYWVRERIFDVPTPDPGEAAKEHKAFSLLLPPPNVTGRLHMGHMLNQTEIDILIRWHRMCGETALWVPGTDHAGIATQMMVERQLASEGTSRKELGRDEFTARVWQWKRQYGSAITDQMRRLGASVDWSREYFTMDERLSPAVVEAFVRLYEQGLIYRGAYIVNWDPQIQTAVSDLEVESEERIGKLYSIRYPFADGTGSIVVATTRPETMLGDTAVAVNPNDDRYKHLIGTMVRLPLTQREIPIVADDWAKPEFGTGAVKVTPAHDPNDFAIGQRHNLPNLTILDQTAHIDLPGSPFHGLDRFKAREAIVAELESIGLLVQVKEHPMTVPVSQRTGTVIEPRLSMQWFLAVSKPVVEGKPSIAQTAVDAVNRGHIKFTPEMYEKTYFEWMNNIHDWCISRQLWWGHRIPAWHCAACSAITVAREIPTACATCGSPNITQETDVLDTWFSSGLLPFTVFGWPKGEGPGPRAQGPEGGAAGTLAPKPWPLNPDLAAFYPTSLLITGFDILFFWVARMIMLGTHFMLDVPMQDGAGGLRARTLGEAVPFKEVYIHALVRDANREKMSKTKGNVIDPIDIIQRYGTDAVRFTLASQASPGTDIAFNEKRTEGYRAFANKIWNAARFLFMNLDRAREAGYKISLSKSSEKHFDADGKAFPVDQGLEFLWISSRLSEVAQEVDASLTTYRFDEAANAVYQFFWGDFCDWYLELVKLRLDFNGELSVKTKEAVYSFILVFDAALRLLSPFMPFLTEELWQALHEQVSATGIPPKKSISLVRYPQATDFFHDPMSVASMTVLQELIVTIRALRKELGVPEKATTPIQIHGASGTRRLVEANADVISRLSRVSTIEFITKAPSGNNTRSTLNFDLAVLYERTIDAPAERERLTKELAKHEKNLATCERQLANEAFMAKAPAHIVEGLRKQAAETLTLRDKAKAALDALGD